MSDFDAVRLIRTKRDGGALTATEITDLVNAYTAGDVPDYQMSAFMMATFLNGFNGTETAAFTRSMLYSGDVLDLSDIPGVKVDKHSTGGVGDKISLILAPLVAACGVPVPMISGRGLGHTGGTLDKMESIPGFSTSLTIDQYREQLAQVGLVMIGQTDEIAPADRMLYALRDVTATVEFIPFIAASIMSKKLAEGMDALVLDVKFGKGAFMKSEADARKLAEALVGIGEEFGKPTVALLTNMSAPLGYAIGNWPEMDESLQCLKGKDVPEITELSLRLSAEMLCLGGIVDSPEAGYEKCKEVLASGAAFDKWVELTAAQGGDVSVLHDPSSRKNISPMFKVLASDEMKGYVFGLDALTLGYAAVDLGAGRRKKEDKVNPTAGILLNKKPGDLVQPGELLATFYTEKVDQVDKFSDSIKSAFTFSENAPEQVNLVHDRYTIKGWEKK